MRAMIVDDDASSRHVLRALLRGEPSVELVGEAGTGRDAIDLVRRRAPDLLFLDIDMPELDGFGVIRELEADRPPAIVLTDGCDRHAVRAFEVHACGYLLNTHPLRESMADLEQELDPARFLRISRSVIVNLDRIQEVQPWFQGDYVLILTDGTRLTSTRGYRENLHRLLGK